MNIGASEAPSRLSEATPFLKSTDGSATPLFYTFWPLLLLVASLIQAFERQTKRPVFHRPFRLTSANCRSVSPSLADNAVPGGDVNAYGAVVGED